MPAIARVGDVHDCPKHGKNTITEGGSGEVDGHAIARLGDACGCGAVIVEGSSVAELDGKPVAYLGCKTSCGGTIISGADTGDIPA